MAEDPWKDGVNVGLVPDQTPVPENVSVGIEGVPREPEPEPPKGKKK